MKLKTISDDVFAWRSFEGIAGNCLPSKHLKNDDALYAIVGENNLLLDRNLS